MSRIAAFLIASMSFTVPAYMALQSSVYVQLHIDAAWHSDSPDQLQIYWQGPEKHFEESRSTKVRLHPGHKKYRFDIPITSSSIRIDLRLDPKNRSRPTAVFRSIAAVLWDRIPLDSWNTNSGFSAWRIGRHLEPLEISEKGLILRSAGENPHIVADVPIASKAWAWLIGLATTFGLFTGALFTLLLRDPERSVARHSGPRSSRLLKLKRTFLIASAMIGIVAGYLVYKHIVHPARMLQFKNRGQISMYSLRDATGRVIVRNDDPAAIKLILYPLLGYRNLPHARDEPTPFDENGFRGGIPKGSQPLAMVTGGSAAFGLWVDSRVPFPRRLNEVYPGYRFVNTAVLSYLSGNELAMMVHYLDRFHPGLYVSYGGYGEIVGGLQHKSGIPYGVNQPMFLLPSNVAFKGTADEFAADDPDRRPWPELTRATYDLGDLTSAYLENIDRMNAFARVRGARFLLVLQPDLTAKRDPTDREREAVRLFETSIKLASGEFRRTYAELRRRVSAWCYGNSIPVLDLNESPEFTGGSDRLFIDNVHLNSKGHEIVARKIAERLKEGVHEWGDYWDKGKPSKHQTHHKKNHDNRKGPAHL